MRDGAGELEGGGVKGVEVEEAKGYTWLQVGR